MNNYNAKAPTKQYSCDLQTECKQDMAENGLESAEIIADGKIHRYAANGKKAKNNEWYKAHEGISDKGSPFLICTYGSWSTGATYVFKSWNRLANLDKEERWRLNEYFKKQRQETEKLLEEQRDAAAKDADKIWQESSATPLTDEYERYAQLKGIEPVGARYALNAKQHASIIVDIRDIEGRIRSLQYISVGDDGTIYKQFLGGGEVKGNIHVFGTMVDGQPIIVTEGYATGASVFQASRKATVVAFSANWLFCVVEKLKEKYTTSEITIAGDADKVGIEKATEAAKRFNGNLVFPSFPKELGKDTNGKDYTDFNDLQRTCGLDIVREQLLRAKRIPTIQDDLKNLAHNLLEKKDPCDSFSVSDLPEVLRDYVSSICEATRAHPLMVTCAVLTTVAAFLGRRVYIPEGEYYQELYPNLWLLNVAKSGQFKTTALNKGARLAWEKNECVTKNIKAYEAQLRVTSEDQEKNDIKEKILKVSLENVLLPNKITAEALLDHLGQGHYGVILASEFGGWLQNLEKNHNNDLKAIFTELYDVPPSYRYKTRTQIDCILNRPYISICGVSTLAWLKQNLKNSDISSGFFARFLIFAPVCKDEVPPALPPNKVVVNAQAEQRVRDILENMDESYAYTLSPSAKLLFGALHEEIYKVPKSYSEKCRETLDPFIKRWSPYLLKLSMIMQLFENLESKEISEKAIFSSFGLLISAMQSTASLFEGELGESEHQHKCRILYEWICQKIGVAGLPVRRQDILASKKLDGGVKEYDEVLGSLIEYGKLRVDDKIVPKNNWAYFLTE